MAEKQFHHLASIANNWIWKYYFQNWDFFLADFKLLRWVAKN